MTLRTAPFTALMLLVCWVVFALDRLGSHGDQIGPLMAAGAIQSGLIIQGQWWRLVTSGFLHFTFLHILFNSYALYQAGIFVEYMYGSARYAAIYLLALLGGGFAAFVSTIGSPVPTAGASGAIMGVFGAIAVLGFKLPPLRGQLLQAALMPIVLTLGYGFMNQNVSNAGHIGGLITGALVALLLTPVRGRALIARASSQAL
jgi:rhomboid protease GluP